MSSQLTKQLRSRLATKDTTIQAQCAEIALLKAQIKTLTNERDIAFRLAGSTAPGLDAKITECELLKAALRWAMNRVTPTPQGLDEQHRKIFEPPPEFAPLIAEAAK